MKKYLKTIFLISILLISLFQTNQVLAAKDEAEISVDGIFSGAKEFIGAKKEDKNYVSESSIKNASSSIYYTFVIVGIIAIAIVGIVLGIQFVTSGVEGKAQVKDALIAYVVGCVVIFGAFGIWKLSITLLSGLQSIGT